jgi:membrane protease YdiL (CAAX protease family)
MPSPADAAAAAAPPRRSRFLAFPLTRLVLGTIALAIPIVIVQAISAPFELDPEGPAQALLFAAAAAGALAAYAAYARLVEGRGLTELRRGDGAAAEVGAGLAIGSALFLATAGALCALASCAIDRTGGAMSLAVALAGGAAAAVSEELLMRGLFLRIAEDLLGTWGALALSAAIFGALHGLNPGATPVSTVAIALEAGVLLGAAYIATRRLWMPIAMHLAWNFVEGGVFGASVSGHGSHGLFTSRFEGPAALVGGEFGPEASIVAVGLCLAAGGALAWRARRLGRVIPPRWARVR